METIQASLHSPPSFDGSDDVSDADDIHLGVSASSDLALGAISGPYLGLKELLMACEEDEDGIWKLLRKPEKRQIQVEMKSPSHFGPIALQVAPISSVALSNQASLFENFHFIGPSAANQWTRHILPALDFYEQNVEIIKSKSGMFRLRVTKEIKKNQQLFAWLCNDLAAEMGLHFLSRSNIKDMNTYYCHLCFTQFRRPNPLKSHILLRHSNFQFSSHLEKSNIPSASHVCSSTTQDNLCSSLIPASARNFSNILHSSSYFVPTVGNFIVPDAGLQSFSRHIWPQRSHHRHCLPHHLAHSQQRQLLTDFAGMCSPISHVNYRVSPHLHRPSLWSGQCSSSTHSDQELNSTSVVQESLNTKTSQHLEVVNSKKLTNQNSQEREHRVGEDVVTGGIYREEENLKMSEESDEPPKFLYKDGMKTRQGYVCPYCGKLYSRKYGLKIHVRTHTGFKPLKCKICQRPFGDPSNLNKHVRLHAEGETPYRCEQCGKVLVRRRDLERHIRSRHSEVVDSISVSSPVEENQGQTVSSSADMTTECHDDIDV